MINQLFDVVLLAGGLATRLRPLTEKIPKSLIDINGEPFIAHQLRLLQQQNIQRVIICHAFLGEQIQAYVDDGSRFGLNVVYSADGNQLLGTAGAIRKVLPCLPEQFFVLYGDSYLLCDFYEVQKVFLQSQKSALMTVFRNHGQWDKSNIEFLDGNIIQYNKIQQTNKMDYIDYGLGIFQKTIFSVLPEKTTIDLADLYQLILTKNELAGCEINQRFYEIGSFSGMAELENYLRCNS